MPDIADTLNIERKEVYQDEDIPFHNGGNGIFHI